MWSGLVSDSVSVCFVGGRGGGGGGYTEQMEYMT